MDYTPVKSFNNFVHSAFNGPRQWYDIPNHSVVAETMMLLADSSYGYQIVDRSHHWVTWYMIEEKHMQRSLIECSSDWDISTINFMT